MPEDERISTITEFTDKILDGVGADINDLPRSSSMLWLGPGGSPVFLEVKKAVPFDPSSFVVAIFHNDAVVRVYTLPLKQPTPVPDGWKVRPPQRYTLSRTASTYVCDEMSLDTMADEIVEEWNQLALEMSSADIELEAVKDYIEGLPPTTTLGQLIEMLDAGLHHEEEEETEIVENGATVPAPPPPAAASGSAEPTTATS